jgi:outer membrane protein TolC
MTTIRASALTLLLALSPLQSRGETGLSIETAIRTAWANNASLKAGSALVEASRQDALAARDARLPMLELHARVLRTDEPAAAFALKLDQGRIAQPDFDPLRLNRPAAVSGAGVGASLTQVLYAGGRISAGWRAREAQAGAEESSQRRRRQELALAIVETYFEALVAEQGLRFADDQLAHARETERFIGARVREAQLPEAEAMRATAVRAQAEAERAVVLRNRESARSALSLLLGEPLRDRGLVTPLSVEVSEPGSTSPALRPDLEAARLRVEAARGAHSVAGGALLPQVFLTVGVDTIASSVSQGNVWTLAMIGARWELGAPALRESAAAGAREVAASAALQWQEQQASREIEEALSAAVAARSRIAAAQEAVTASQSARALREARHRQGLLPLTDLLDAEAGLSGARTLLLRSQLELRIARAQLDLSLGNPVEGVTP